MGPRSSHGRSGRSHGSPGLSIGLLGPSDERTNRTLEAYGGTSLETWFLLEIQPAWLISCCRSHVQEQVKMTGQPD